jgi:hypothetical protein
LAVVRPFGNLWSYFVVDGGSNRFVVHIFEPKGAGVVSSAICRIDGVGVVGAFWEKYAEADVERVFGEVAITEVILGSLEGASAFWAGVVPASVSNAVHPRRAILGVFEECSIVRFVGRWNVVEVEWYAVFSGELFREVAFDGFVGKNVGPLSDNLSFFTLRVVGDGAVGSYDAHVDSATSKRVP